MLLGTLFILFVTLFRCDLLYSFFSVPTIFNHLVEYLRPFFIPLTKNIVFSQKPNHLIQGRILLFDCDIGKALGIFYLNGSVLLKTVIIIRQLNRKAFVFLFAAVINV